MSKTSYPGEGQAWADFLHHRARTIDWLFLGEGDPSCRADHAAIARTLSMTQRQVEMIYMRDRKLDHAWPTDDQVADAEESRLTKQEKAHELWICDRCRNRADRAHYSCPRIGCHGLLRSPEPLDMARYLVCENGPSGPRVIISFYTPGDAHRAHQRILDLIHTNAEGDMTPVQSVIGKMRSWLADDEAKAKVPGGCARVLAFPESDVKALLEYIDAPSAPQEKVQGLGGKITNVDLAKEAEKLKT